MSDFTVTPENIELNYYPVGVDLSMQQNQGQNTDAPTSNERPSSPATNNVPTMPPHYNIEPAPNGGIINSGRLTSANFLQGKSGWGLQADGSGWFSDIDIGNHYITVNPGENIQDAIDSLSAGGIVVIRIGTHTVNYDINIPSGVYLVGENRSTSIIDFNSGAYSIKCIGSAAYSGGTVAISNNSTTVTGSSTSWLTNAAVGQSIRIKGIWYPILAVSDDTHITIGLPFVADDVTGESYVIATPVYDVFIRDLTIKGSAQAAINWQYVNLSIMSNLIVQTSNVGIQLDYVSNSTLDIVNAYANNYGYDFSNVDFLTWFSGGDADSQAGNAITLDTVNNCKFDSLFILNAAGDGMNITNCNNIMFTGISVQECAGQGIELVSGNSAMIMVGVGCENNTGDGLKLTATSDNCFISSSSFKGNGGYGVNIVASTCDNNVISSNVFATNVSGAVNDGGTGTQIRGNSGVTDNNGAQVTTYTSGSGNWTKPTGCTSVFVQVWGAGGAGGGTIAGTSATHGGGGGGGYNEFSYNASDLGTTVAYAVGSGGVGTNGDGGNGGDTNFGTLYAYGGAGAKGGADTAQLSGGGGGGIVSAGNVGGAAIGGDGGTPMGGAGGSGADGATSIYGGGGGGASGKNGGESINGGGGGGGQNGIGGRSYGGGGGGGGGNASTPKAGGVSVLGGSGGDGKSNAAGGVGTSPGGGGGGVGSNDSATHLGGNGANGKIIVSAYF